MLYVIESMLYSNELLIFFLLMIFLGSKLTILCRQMGLHKFFLFQTTVSAPMRGC